MRPNRFRQGKHGLRRLGAPMAFLGAWVEDTENGLRRLVRLCSSGAVFWSRTRDGVSHCAKFGTMLVFPKSVLFPCLSLACSSKIVLFLSASWSRTSPRVPSAKFSGGSIAFPASILSRACSSRMPRFLSATDSAMPRKVVPVGMGRIFPNPIRINTKYNFTRKRYIWLLNVRVFCVS